MISGRMSLIASDSKFQNFITALKETIGDNEPNEVIQEMIQRFYGQEYHQIINDTTFCYTFFEALINGCLTSNRQVMDETKLMDRCKLMRQFVFNYVEYQLNLVLILCNIKQRHQLSDQLFDGLLRSLHTMGVVSDEASDHWFRCRRDFAGRVNAVENCIKLLDWTQEVREDYYFEMFDKDLVATDDMLIDP